MDQQAHGPIHTLIIPIGGIPLLVPSAIIAEVVNVPELVPLPFSQQWVLGVVGWRQRAVPVISFEALMGAGVTPPGLHSKVMIFFPLPGRTESEFFGILTSSEPQPRTIDSAEGLVTEAPESRYIATCLKFGDMLVGIPDMDALKAAFYP